jgi:hypothetical protein
MTINKIFLEPDGLVVGDNQLVASGGGVSVGKNLVVQGAAFVSQGLVVPDISTANSLYNVTGALRYNSGNLEVYSTTGWSVLATTASALASALAAAGSDSQVQYNSNGTTAGSSNFTWTTGTSTLAVNGTVRASISFTSPSYSTNGAQTLTVNTNGGLNSGSIVINQGVNGNIAVTPNGTGVVNLGDMTGAGLVTTGTITSNLTLNTNNGANSGSIVITAGTNGAITLTPSGTGSIALTSSTIVQGISNTATTLTTNGTANLTLNTNSGTNSGSIVINQGVNGNISLTPNGTGSIVLASLTGLLKGTSGTVSTAAASDINSTFGSQTQNYVYAGPSSGGNGNPSFRALVAADIPGTLSALTITGNLIVNGTTTTINSNTVSVDDKNLELGGVVATSPTGNISAGSAVVTNLSATANIIPGSAVSSLSGNGTVTLPASTTVLSIDSATQITLNQALTGSGSATGATLNIGGATDVTADGGGITLLGTTNKTITYVNSTTSWDSNINLNLTGSGDVNRTLTIGSTSPSGTGTNQAVINLGSSATATAPSTSLITFQNTSSGYSAYISYNRGASTWGGTGLTGLGILSNISGEGLSIITTATGTIGLSASTVQLGKQNTASTITTYGTANLTINTNNGTNAGSIVLNNGTNGNIDITTNGTGKVDLITSTTQLGVSNTATTLTTNGTGNLTINTNSGTNAGSIVLNQGTNGNITVVPNGTGKIGFYTTSPVSKVTIVSAGGTVPTIAFPDATNNRYNTGIGSRQVTNIGQILDIYSGDSGTNGTDLGSGQIRATVTPMGYVGINQTQPNALLHVNNSRGVNSSFNLSTVSAMDATLDTITFSAVHNLNTGDMVFYIPGSGGAIGGLAGSFNLPQGWQYFYYVQTVDTTTVKLHTSSYNANAQSTPIDLTGTLPAGTHTFRKGTEWTQLSGNNGNGTLLHTYHHRHTDGADWTGDSTRIQQRIDVTPQGYIEFNPPGSTYGVAFGSGNNLETFRISASSLILGVGDTYTTAIARTIRMTNMSGTDISAGTLSIQGGLSTGTGTGGAIKFYTGTTLTTGSTLQTAQERLSIDTASASTILNLSTPATTANLFTANATTVNVGAPTSVVNMGDITSSGTLTTGSVTANLTLNTNNGSTSGSFVINAGANGNIDITPNGSGLVRIPVAGATMTLGPASGSQGSITLNLGNLSSTSIPTNSTINFGNSSAGTSAYIRAGQYGGIIYASNILDSAQTFSNSTTTNTGTAMSMGYSDNRVTVNNTMVVQGNFVSMSNAYFGGNIVGGTYAAYDLDELTLNDSKSAFPLTFNQLPVAVANPFSLMVTVNGLVQPAFVVNYDPIWTSCFFSAYRGYTVQTSTANLSTVAITGSAGQFSCLSAPTTLYVGQTMTITGTNGNGSWPSAGTIQNYVSGTTYYIVATNGSTTFQLAPTLGAIPIITASGTPTGLTYTIAGGSTIKFAGSVSPQSTVMIRSTGINAATPPVKRYPFKPAEIMLGT